MRPTRCIFVHLLIGILIGNSLPAPARAAVPDLPTIDISAIVPQEASGEIVKTLGVLTKHRSYQGAAPLGGSFDIGLEATLVHLPSSFGPTLESLGMGDASSFTNASLPMTKLQLHKGAGPNTDFGISGIYYPGNFIWGVDLKFVLTQPEEGAMSALRISYSETGLDLSKFGLSGLPLQVDGVDVGQGNLKMKTRTITPELVISKKLEFVEPYVGAGVEFTSGQIEIPITLNVLPEPQVLRTAPSHSTQYTLFSGVSFKVPHVGLHLALEGAYGSLGMHRLGLVVGLGY